jgi:hypothetical protein
MDIKSITEKIKNQLTEEEINFFSKHIRNEPEKIMQALYIEPKNKIDKLASEILNDIYISTTKYGVYDYYDKGIYYDDSKIQSHIKSMHKLYIQEAQDLLVKLLNEGCRETMVYHFIGSYDGLIDEEQFRKLVDHNLLLDIY